MTGVWSIPKSRVHGALPKGVSSIKRGFNMLGFLRLCLGSTIKSAWFQKMPPGPYSWLGWEGAFLRGHLQPNPRLTTASMVVSCSPWPCSNCPQALGGGASVFQSQVWELRL